MHVAGGPYAEPRAMSSWGLNVIMYAEMQSMTMIMTMTAMQFIVSSSAISFPDLSLLATLLAWAWAWAWAAPGDSSKDGRDEREREGPPDPESGKSSEAAASASMIEAPESISAITVDAVTDGQPGMGASNISERFAPAN